MNLLFSLLGARWRWRVLEMLQPRFISNAPIIVIGGCGSSGTTLLRRMLDRHPAIQCGAESTVLLDRLTSVDELAARFGLDAAALDRWQRTTNSQAEFVERFRAACLARSGKRIWADKTPENIRRFDFVLRHFPNARFVHVIRDGRDVANSLRRQPWMKLRDRMSPQGVAHCAAYWAERVAAGCRMRGHSRYVEIRYEELVHRPEPTLRGLLDFLCLGWSDRLLRADAGAGEPASGPIFGSSIGRWRRDLAPTEVEALKRTCGPLLRELGYESDPSWPASAEAPRSRRLWRWRPKRWSRWERLRIEAETLWRLARDRRVPWRARIVALMLCAGYYLMPIDPIPDRIPIVGHLDDAMVVAAVLLLFSRLTPGWLLRQHRSSVTARYARRLEPKPQ